LEVHASGAEEAVRAADVIVTATGAAEPVFDGAWVRPGTHVNATGSNAREKREVDRTLLDRAAVVVTDDREVAQLDCGDLHRNGWDPATVPTLGELLLGSTPGRRGDDDITLFESQGLAIQDVVCAAYVLRRADGAGEEFG
jgi:ornithine cyclodeaminase/alanine dehydrogenase-like protein (mu-crystallin family)